RPRGARTAASGDGTAASTPIAGGHRQAKSIRSLAKLVGRSESAVRKWVARSDWPVSRTGPWAASDIRRIRAWMDVMLKPDPAAAYRKRAKAADAGTGEFRSMGALERARIQATLERALYIRQKRMSEAGELHSVADCQRHRLQQIMEVRNRLMEIPRSMASGLAGLPAERIGAELDRTMRAIVDDFAAGAAPSGGRDDG
ncbi:MAG TPA: hypothetical protein VMY35_19570, partial [Phycisphaerae bacterium]|nr:hypothetical protein [Phycisphaerae bacterium]